MKANRRPRQEPRDEAVSNVLGGIMFFALVFVFLATIQVSYVPVWEEDKEARHAEKVLGQMAAIKGEADRQAGNLTAIPGSNPISLGERSSSRLFTGSGSAAVVTFQPGNDKVHLSTNEFNIIEQNGRQFFGVDETWNSISTGSTVANIADLKHIRIRLDNPGDEADGDKVELSITDANGNFAGRMTAYISTHPSGYSIKSKVVNANNVVLYDQGESAFQQDKPPFYWIDAFASELQFIDVVEAAVAPFDLTLTETGMTGAYSIAFIEDQGGTQITVGGGGKLLKNFTRDWSGGHLDVDMRPGYYPQQKYRFENGAIILDQEGAAYMRVEPSINIAKGTTATKIVLTIPVLNGNADSVSQTGTVTVAQDGVGETNLIGSMPRLLLEFSTQYPDQWETYFTDMLVEAGLNGGAGEYTITKTADQVSIHIYGSTTDPASTVHDLQVELHQATVNLSIQT